MRRAYQSEINKLQKEKIDAAFVPVDPRLGEQYCWGLDCFMKRNGHKEGIPHAFLGKSIQYSTDFPREMRPGIMRTGSSGSSGRDRPSCWKNKRAERLELCL